MKNILIYIMLLMLFNACSTDEKVVENNNTMQKKDYAIVLHGGAGYVSADNLSQEQKDEYFNALNTAISLGENLLKEGKSAGDAVEEVIAYLENQPMFNAGIGAVFTHDGKNELDASFMDGNTMNAGAVGGVTIVKNPIKAARAVMDKSPHVLLTGKGAETFSIEQGLDTVNNKYFFNQDRWNSLQRILDEEAGQGMELDHTEHPSDKKFGTVGCVALDKNGNLAAGTSTGGMTNKKWGRIGDSPIIGAGTYADNTTCGVSCTGHGEYFIRYAVAYDLSAKMKYKGLSLNQAADEIVMKELKEVGGAGGLVALDKYGNVAMPFNTGCMFRAYVCPDERIVKIWE